MAPGVGKVLENGSPRALAVAGIRYTDRTLSEVPVRRGPREGHEANVCPPAYFGIDDPHHGLGFIDFHDNVRWIPSLGWLLAQIDSASGHKGESVAALFGNLKNARWFFGGIGIVLAPCASGLACVVDFHTGTLGRANVVYFVIELESPAANHDYLTGTATGSAATATT